MTNTRAESVERQSQRCESDQLRVLGMLETVEQLSARMEDLGSRVGEIDRELVEINDRLTAMDGVPSKIDDLSLKIDDNQALITKNLIEPRDKLYRRSFFFLVSTAGMWVMSTALGMDASFWKAALGAILK